MQPELAVILPDGSYEFGVEHLIPEDVPVIPIHPEADVSDALLPEHEKSRDFYLRMFEKGYIDHVLGCGRGETISAGGGARLDPPPYGNKRSYLGQDYETIRD